MSDDGDLQLSAAMSREQTARLDALCDRFERQWKSASSTADRPVLEAFLEGVPAAEQAAAANELLTIDVHYRRKAGDDPGAADYRDRLPMLPVWKIIRATSMTPVGGDTSHHPPRRRDQHGFAPIHPDAPPVVPGYEALNLLGHGGMGVVYKARDARLQRPVALKFLRADCCREPAALERFQREAKIASGLNHPHICTVYAMGEHEGLPYIAMEFVEGQTLRAIGRGGAARSLAEIAPIVQQVARALAVAHAAGIVHRDIKPENIVARPDGIAKILDFGLARLLANDAPPASGSMDGLTARGTLLGTVRYMAPEQARRESAQNATDIFSLGVVFYELVTGHHPFHADSDLATLNAICSASPITASRLNPELSGPVGRLIEQMLSKEAALRPTGAEVDVALASVIQAAGGTPRRNFAPGPVPGAKRPTVGREKELAALWAGFASASDGRGQVRCVTGEPGIGKTTLVEEFLAGLTAAEGCRVARGRCSERLSGAEAYLPILEALDSLARGEAGDSAARALRLIAPAWYAEVASSSSRPADPANVTPPTDVAAPTHVRSQQRMTRELFSLLEELSRLHPLILFLDDVHWADASTVDLLGYIGARCGNLRLLLIVTYRPAELRMNDHPFRPVQLELQRHGICEEVALPFLSHGEVRSYLDIVYPNHRFPSAFEKTIHANTEGNPLFLVDLLQYLSNRGVVAERPDGWTLARDMPDFQRALPASISSLIEQKLSQLDEPDRTLLSIAAVQGCEFDSSVIARAENLDVVDVEERLASLERVQGLVRLRREHELPDGTLALRYQFVHVLYQNALYAAMQPARRIRSNGRLAEALLELHPGKASAVAGELAVLFEAARDWSRAIEHLQVAAANAVRLFAHAEAVVLAKRGIGLLAKLPDSPARVRTELQLQMTLALQLQMTKGFAAPDVEEAYGRASTLFAEATDLAQLFPFLWGSWMFYVVRGPMRLATEASDRLLSAVEGEGDPIRSMHANHSAHATNLHRGELLTARKHMEREWALYDPATANHLIEHYAHNTGMCCLGFGAMVLWLLGYPDQALKSSLNSVGTSLKQGHPFTLGFAYYFGAKLNQYRGDDRTVRELAEAGQALADEHGFSLWHAGTTYLKGWALTRQGEVDEGLTVLRQGIDAWRNTGASTHRPYQLALLAETLGKLGHVHEGLAALDEASALIGQTGENYWLADVLRLQGELRLLANTDDRRTHDDAEGWFQQAIDVSREQNGKSLELRATMSLARLRIRQGRGDEGLRQLSAIFHWFTEGLDTPDLLEASAMLFPGHSTSL